ncbi:MAG: PaaI family thioesterase [Parvibaculaceae bacterium]
MTGLERLLAIRNGEAQAPPLYKLLGITVVAASAGAATLALTPSDRQRSPLGTVGGGVIATVLDTAAAWACDTLCPPGKVTTTVDIKVNFLRPVRVDDAALTAVAQVVHAGARIMVATATLGHGDGRPAAIATATCLVVDA